MKCLYCDCTESKVIDSRSADDDRTIRRRRECVGCGRRFTTYETIEVTPVLVVKNNGTRQSFSAPGGMEAAAGAAGACMAARSSRCTENALPCPSSLRTEMRPPIRSTMALTIARPSPEPCVPCS